jgi:predicted CoA-binding protein
MTKTPRSVIDGFLEGRRIAFVGLSTHEEDFSRMVDRKLLEAGYEVVPVHPGVPAIDLRPAFRSVSAIPFEVDGALIMTPAAASLEVVEDCLRAGVTKVWLHRGVGRGSVSDAAVAYAEAHGMQVVAGECPLMFLPHAEAIHRAHAFAKKVTGSYPFAPGEEKPRVPLSMGSALSMIGVDWLIFGATMLWGLTALAVATGLFAALAGVLVLGFERREGRSQLGLAVRAVLAALAVALPLPIAGTLLGALALLWIAVAHGVPHPTTKSA